MSMSLCFLGRDSEAFTLFFHEVLKVLFRVVKFIRAVSKSILLKVKIIETTAVIFVKATTDIGLLATESTPLMLAIQV